MSSFARLLINTYFIANYLVFKNCFHPYIHSFWNNQCHFELCFLKIGSLFKLIFDKNRDQQNLDRCRKIKKVQFEFFFIDKYNIKTERQGTERQGTERQGTERKGTERQGTERQGTERQGTERQGTDIQGTERQKNRETDQEQRDKK